MPAAVTASEVEIIFVMIAQRPKPNASRTNPDPNPNPNQAHLHGILFPNQHGILLFNSSGINTWDRTNLIHGISISVYTGSSRWFIVTTYFNFFHGFESTKTSSYCTVPLGIYDKSECSRFLLPYYVASYTHTNYVRTDGAAQTQL